MSQKEDFEQEIEQLENEAYERRRQNDETGYLLKMNEANQKRAELDQLNAQEAAKEAVIAEVQSADSSFSILGVDFRSMAANEESYQALAIAVQLHLQEIDRQHDAEKAALKESYESELAQTKEQHENAIAHKEQEYDALYEQFDQAKKEREDAESKLKAAGEEISTLRRQVEELRVQAVKPAAPTNLDTTALQEAIRKAQEAKPAIYDIVQLDNKGSLFGAKLAKTGEEITFNYLEKGKYREVTAEEAESFRNQAAEEAAATVEPIPQTPESDTALGVEAPPLSNFQDEHGEQQHVSENADGSHVGTPSQEATIEERVAKLEAAVFGRVGKAA